PETATPETATPETATPETATPETAATPAAASPPGVTPPAVEVEPAPAVSAPAGPGPRTPPTPPTPSPGLDASPRRGSRRERLPAPAALATRRLARQLGVDLHGIRGSGPAGRITQEDVKAHVKQRLRGDGAAPAPSAEAPPLPDFSEWGEIERQPLKGIRRATAQQMSLAWHVVPHVNQFDEADITELEAARRRYDGARPEGAPKVTVTALMLKAVVAALKTFPQFNSSLDTAAGELVFKRYYHIGVAVDTEHGLIVPVIRDADRKPVVELARELGDLADRARRRKLELSEMKGGTFTVTNLGGIGGTAFTPIVNYPEVAILGMARSREVPVVRDGNVVTRRVLPLCLSYDHRVIDGADGARFVRHLVRLLEEPFHFILEL
ncbi:MAG: dihydrolipoamide acetyltransferase family protein, partial [Planctomycetota bacterium]|nr:dihydrolipoamide acetyltransferase family protein [Planctomycetota bacterium]